MKIIDAATLHFQDGRSDKVYHAYIGSDDGLCHCVVALYGRRGQTLQETRKGDNLSAFEARTKFDKIVREKTAKGYSPADSSAMGIPAAVRANQTLAATSPVLPRREDSGLRPQLLNAITEDAAAALLGDPAFGLQEKKNGVRLMVRKEGVAISAAGRTGHIVAIRAELEASLLALGGSFVLDGELVDDTFFVFDVLEDFGRDLRARSYRERYGALLKILLGSRTNVQLIALYTEENEKRAAFDALRAGNREGVVFKRLDAPWSAGRPATGGPQLKCKFWSTASAIVAGHNDKSSVKLMMLAQRSLGVRCGCGGKHDETSMRNCRLWTCACAAASELAGFTPCNVFGERAAGNVTGELSRCDRCGKTVDADGVDVERVSVGNVTVKANQILPALGAIVEVKYLHVMNAGGHLIQPELLAERSDVDVAECTVKQLKIEGAAA